MPTTAADAIFYYIGTGIVSEAKEPDSDTITCYPQELLADASGNVTDTTDIGGLTQADLITAEYRATDAYAIGSPMVVEGDIVILLQRSDTNVIYWEPHSKSLIRKIAKVKHVYPAKKREDTLDKDDNQYTVNLDTEEGILSILTTKDRDEPVAYSIGLSTHDGKFTFSVDNGDILEWDNVSKTFTLLTDAIKITAKTVEVTADTALITAETTIDGSLTVTGDIRGNKSVRAKGSMASGGNVSAKGSMRAGRVMSSSLGRFPNLD